MRLDDLWSLKVWYLQKTLLLQNGFCLYVCHHIQYTHYTLVTLHASCSAVYCNRSCLFVVGGRCVLVGLLPR